MVKRSFYFITLLLFIISCDNTTDTINTDNSVIIDKIIFQNTKTDNYTILDVQLNGNDLTIKIGSSGCSSDYWKATLIDSGAVLESFPVQRNIKLNLENNEACLAYFEVEYTFNLKFLIKNLAPVNFNLDGWNQQINYE